MNGKNADGSCKEEPWSLGQTGLSLNGYGADGYKIIFNANGGAFAGSAVTKNIYLASGMAITDNEVGKPSRNGFSFEGWAATADATESLENLGTVSKSTKFYAVWAPLNTIIFNVAPGSFSLGEQSKTKQVANGEVITVEGLGALPTTRCKKYVSGTEDECETWSYFTGWALTEGALESDSVSLDTVTASDSLVLYAVWTDVETYTVTYNANQHGRTTVDYVRVGAGDTVSAPTDPIADSGYEFAGWFTDAECTNQLTNPVGAVIWIHEGNKLIPLKPENGFVEVTYYAKFVKQTNVTIEKQVTGNLGDKTREFEFQYSLDGKTWSDTFTLKHGDIFTTPQKLDVGATIYVREKAAADYSTTASHASGTLDVDNDGEYKKVTVTVLDSDKVTFTNNKEATPDTGVLLDSLPYVVILAVVVLGAALVIVRRRKHRDDD